MIPLAVMHDRVQPPGFVGPVIDAVQRKALVGDALEQALGVAFALLVVISVIGAVLGRDRDGGQGNR